MAPPARKLREVVFHGEPSSITVTYVYICSPVLHSSKQQWVGSEFAARLGDHQLTVMGEYTILVPRFWGWKVNVA